jgi:hypothetical protein
MGISRSSKSRNAVKLRKGARVAKVVKAAKE